MGHGMGICKIDSDSGLGERSAPLKVSNSPGYVTTHSALMAFKDMLFVALHVIGS